MYQKKSIKVLVFILSYVIVGFVFSFVFDSIGIYKSYNAKPNQEDVNKTTLINTLESYYGEWEIVEDFGYHGIHRITEIEEFEIGKVITFQRDVFRYEDSIDISYPRVVIEMTTSANMQQVDRMEYPHQMGFDDQYAQYAKIALFNNTSSAYNFYILNDNEIIVEGDVHRYYRAVKKN